MCDYIVFLMSDETDGTETALSAEVVEAYDVLVAPDTDQVLEQKVNEAVKQILIFDPRLQDADIETIDALRDYVRVEGILSRAYRLIVGDRDDSSTERTIRACLGTKITLRKEIWDPVKDKKGRDRELDDINRKVLIDTGVVDAKAKLE